MCTINEANRVFYCVSNVVLKRGDQPRRSHFTEYFFSDTHLNTTVSYSFARGHCNCIYRLDTIVSNYI